MLKNWKQSRMENPEMARFAVDSVFRPVTGKTTVHFDAGLSTGKRLAGFGVYIANSDGEFMNAYASTADNVVDPELAELMALREALRTAKELKLTDFQIVGDSINAIMIGRGEVEGPYAANMVIHDIKNLLNSFPNLNLCWISRLENYVAHEVADFAKSCNVRDTLWSSPQDWLSFSAG